MKSPLRAYWFDNFSWIFITIQIIGLVYGGPATCSYSSASLDGKHLVITGLEVRIYISYVIDFVFYINNSSILLDCSRFPS